MLGLVGIPSRFPDQSLSEAQMKEKYGSIKNFYLECARNLSLSYNKLPSNDFNKTSQGVGGGEVQQILNNYDYFQGVQQNTDFAYLTQTMDTNGQIEEMSTPYMAGQDIAQILLFMQGQFMGVAASAEPRVQLINPDMKNKLTKQLKMVQVKKQFGDLLKKITEETGYEFKPPADPTKDTETIVKTLQMSFSSDVLRDANIILDYVKKNSMGLSDYLRSLTNVLIGRRCVLFVDDEGNIEDVPPYLYFSVASKDDDFGKKDFARGMVEYIHKDDVLAKYQDQLTSDEISNIKDGSFYGTELFNFYMNMYNFSMYNNQNSYMSKVTVYWKSTIDTRYKVVSTDEGGKKVIKLKPSTNKKGLPAQVIRKATILANMYVVDYGIHEIIEDPNQQGNKLFPILCFQPNTYLGYNQSLVDRLKNKQKELDAINQRVRENYTMDLGTVLSFNGKKFKDGITPDEIYMQLRRTRFTVSTASGEDEDYTNNQPMLQREDVSLMRDIQNYLSIKTSLQQDVKDIANVSSIIMGSQQNYVGLRTQQNSQALAANSVQYYYTGTLQCWADAAALAIEVVKNKIAKNPDKQKWQNLLGEEGVDRIVALSKEPYWKLQAYISTQDIIDPIRKQRMLAMLDNLMATGQIDFVDWLNVEDAKTMTELKELAKYSVSKKQEQQRVMQMLSDATNMQRTEIMAQGQAQAKQIEQQGQAQIQQSKNVKDIASTMIKKDYPMEDVAALMQGAAGEPSPQQQPNMM